MAYIKTIWEARDGSNLDRFEKEQETAKSVILRNKPTEVTKSGTKFSIQNMNKIENGIFEAHELVAEETQVRERGDQVLESKTISLQKNIDYTNDNLQTLQRDFNAWIGRGGFLDAFDFGRVLEASNPQDQDDLTNYALSQISSITDPLQIWNGTRVTNSYNGHTFVLTNTQDTEPPIFEWNDNGSGTIAPLGENYGGYAKGAAREDPPEYIRAVAGGDGKIKIEIALLEKIFFLAAHPVHSIFQTYDPDLNTAAKMNERYPGSTWEACSKGRVLMGVGSNDANTDTSDGGSMAAGQINKTAAGIKGGNKLHTLTQSEMPSHRHDLKNSVDGSGNTITSHSHDTHEGTFDNSTPATNLSATNFNTTGTGIIKVISRLVTKLPQMLTSAAHGAAGTPGFSINATHSDYYMSVANAGSGGGHNNMMPFETCYTYKRLS